MAELKGLLEFVWSNLSFNDREAGAGRGNVAGSERSRELQVCAKQHTIFFKAEPIGPGFKETPTAVIDETTEKRDE